MAADKNKIAAVFGAGLHDTVGDIEIRNGARLGFHACCIRTVEDLLKVFIRLILRGAFAVFVGDGVSGRQAIKSDSGGKG